MTKETDAETGAHLLPADPQPVSPRTEDPAPDAGEDGGDEKGATDADGEEDMDEGTRAEGAERGGAAGLADFLSAAIGAQNQPAGGEETLKKALASLDAPHVRLHGLGAGIVAVAPSSESLKQVRAHFNPSGLENVNQIKLLSAVLIDLLRAVQREMPEGGREAAVAITHVQTACMFGVAGATAAL